MTLHQYKAQPGFQFHNPAWPPAWTFLRMVRSLCLQAAWVHCLPLFVTRCVHAGEWSAPYVSRLPECAVCPCLLHAVCMQGNGPLLMSPGCLSALFAPVCYTLCACRWMQWNPSLKVSLGNKPELWRRRVILGQIYVEFGLERVLKSGLRGHGPWLGSCRIWTGMGVEKWSQRTWSLVRFM